MFTANRSARTGDAGGHLHASPWRTDLKPITRASTQLTLTIKMKEYFLGLEVRKRKLNHIYNNVYALQTQGTLPSHRQKRGVEL